MFALITAIGMIAMSSACAPRNTESQKDQYNQPPSDNISAADDNVEINPLKQEEPLEAEKKSESTSPEVPLDTEKESELTSNENEVSDEIKKLLPIEDEFIALDLVKEYLKLEGFEQVPNGSGGYTYKKETYGLVGSGHGIYKETGERIFIVYYIQYNSESLAKGLYEFENHDIYAVSKDTGIVRKVTMDEIER